MVGEGKLCNNQIRADRDCHIHLTAFHRSSPLSPLPEPPFVLLPNIHPKIGALGFRRSSVFLWRTDVA